MEDSKFRYVEGQIHEVVRGGGNLITGILDIDQIIRSVTPKVGGIYVPRVIGVYQEDFYTELLKNLPINMKVFAKDPLQDWISRIKGRRDGLPYNLISLIYDSTEMNLGLIGSFVQNDVLNRIKFTGLDQTGNFTGKVIPSTANEMIGNLMFMGADPEQYAGGLESEIENLELLRENFGLARHEALMLFLAKRFKEKLDKLPEIIIPPRNFEL